MNKVKTGGSILLVPIEDVLPPEYASRKVVSLEELYKLADSIRSSGVLTPLVVKNEENGCYRVISGERRRRAALIAGCDMLPCILTEVDGFNSVIYNISENLHRKELHFLETATILDELHENVGIEELSEYLSVPEGMILSRIKLLTLPESVRWKIMTSQLSENVANALVRVNDSVRQNEIADIIISSGCSFKEAFEMTEKMQKKTIFAAKYRDYKIFENTIEHAVETMQKSGIISVSEKQEDDCRIVYTVSINKLI